MGKGLRVRGNHLVDGGKVVRLIGVNRSDLQDYCISSRELAGGPLDQRAIRAMASWGINAVRVPINETCWLGINRVDRRHGRLGGRPYRRAVARYVRRLRRQGLYVILDNHYAGPGRIKAAELLPMADRGHAPRLWRSIARRFRRTSGVVFDLYNEPHDISWRCWLRGCRVRARLTRVRTPRTVRYRAAGMGRLVRAVRSVGARQPIMLSGNGFGNDLLQWRRYRPRRRGLIASIHAYEFNGCAEQCRANLDRLRRRFPVVFGELGETDCRHAFVDDLMRFSDARGISYLLWTWNAPPGWGCQGGNPFVPASVGGPALIESFDGTPNSYGVGVRDHIRKLRADLGRTLSR